MLFALLWQNCTFLHRVCTEGRHEIGTFARFMTKSPPTHIPFLDFAKGYAIFTIVVYHTLQRLPLSPLWQKAAIFGGTGVHLFFLLSGFGLGLSIARQSAPRVPAMAFYQRRLQKIWAPYALALTISLLAAWAFGLFQDGWAAWAAGVGLYQMFFERYIASFGGHFWFISAIIQFYLVFPALVWVRTRLGSDRIFVLVALAVSAAWWLIVFLLGKGELRTWNSCFLQFLWEFALGMALSKSLVMPNDTATLPVRGDFWGYKPWWIYVPVGLFFTGFMILIVLKMGEWGRIFNDIPALIGYGALCVALFQGSERFLPWLSTFFIWVGRYSFSLYLVHVLILEAFLHALSAFGTVFSFVHAPIYWGLALLGAWLFEPVSQWFTAHLPVGKSAATPLQTK